MFRMRAGDRRQSRDRATRRRATSWHHQSGRRLVGRSASTWRYIWLVGDKQGGGQVGKHRRRVPKANWEQASVVQQAKPSLLPMLVMRVISAAISKAKTAKVADTMILNKRGLGVDGGGCDTCSTRRQKQDARNKKKKKKKKKKKNYADTAHIIGCGSDLHVAPLGGLSSARHEDERVPPAPVQMALVCTNGKMAETLGRQRPSVHRLVPSSRKNRVTTDLRCPPFGSW